MKGFFETTREQFKSPKQGCGLLFAWGAVIVSLCFIEDRFAPTLHPHRTKQIASHEFIYSLYPATYPPSELIRKDYRWILPEGLKLESEEVGVAKGRTKVQGNDGMLLEVDGYKVSWLLRVRPEGLAPGEHVIKLELPYLSLAGSPKARGMKKIDDGDAIEIGRYSIPASASEYRLKVWPWIAGHIILLIALPYLVKMLPADDD